MNIFFYFEHLCFKELCETLQSKYKEKIPEELPKKINNELLKNNLNEGIEVKHLASAVRRYISRYLAGGTQLVDIVENRCLSFELVKIDLWEEKIGHSDNLGELIYSKIGEFNLTVGQAYEFYKLIESEDEKIILNNSIN